MTNQTRDNLSKTFLTGLSGIIKISGYLKSFKNLASYISIGFSILIIISAILFNVNIYNLIVEIKNIIITFLPGVLGFTIAGYTLVVGFIQSNMLEKISDRLGESDFSLYQKMSSVFALNVIIQGVALVIAYVVHFVIYFDSNSGNKTWSNECFVRIINWASLIIISISFSFSLILVIQIIVNIFNFSQLHHYFVNKEKIEIIEKEKKNNNVETNV